MTCAEIKYLLAIKSLSLANPSVKLVEIANEMEYSRASVSKMIDNFEVKGLVRRNSDKTASFTPNGSRVAEEYFNAYLRVKDFLLTRFACGENVASKDAKNILSALSPVNLKQLF